MTVRQPGGPIEPLTLVFAKRRAPVAQFLRQRSSDGDSPAEGPSTPGSKQRGLKARIARLRPDS